MKQYIKFLKFLWVILIVPSLYGMVDENNHKRSYSLSDVKVEDQEASSKKAKVDEGYKNIKYSLDNYPNLIEVIMPILKVGISAENKAKDLVKYVLKTFFEHIEEGINLLLWDGSIYLNGLIPISDFDDSLQIEGVREEPYPVVQLCEILGYKDKKIKKKLEATGRIADCFSSLQETLTWNTICEFWYDIRGKEDDQIDSMFEKHMRKSENWPSKDPNFDMYLIAVADYMKSLNELGVYTRNLEFDMSGLFKSLNDTENETRDLMEEFLEKFGNYINFLDPDDGKSFLDDLMLINALPKRKGYLIKAHKLWTKKKYNRYTHTECIVEYLWKKQKEKGTQPALLNMISFRDVCKYCKKMFAKIPPEYNITVISGKQYLKYDPNCRFCNQRRKGSDGDGKYDAVIDPECNNCEDSRAKEHSSDQNNSNLSQIQLSPDFYLTN